MMAVVKDRPKLKPHIRHFQEIRELAESCARQLTAWSSSLEASPVQGKRHLVAAERQKREMADKARRFRENFPRSLTLPATRFTPHRKPVPREESRCRNSCAQ
jgi:hypothetical protein